MRITGIPKNALNIGAVALGAVGNWPVNTSVTPAPAATAKRVAFLPVSETESILLYTCSSYSGLSYMIVSWFFKPRKPPSTALVTVAIPELLNIISVTLLGRGAFWRTVLPKKVGKSVTPACLTDLMSFTPNVLTVPTPTGKSTPLTSNCSPLINLPDVWVSFNVLKEVVASAQNPIAPLLLPTTIDDTGISLGVIFLFKIKSVLVWISYKCKSHLVVSFSYAASFKLNPYALALPIFAFAVWFVFAL